MHENRFFPEPQLDKARLAEFLSYLVLTVGSIQTEWFRARIMESSDPYPPDKMGAPPKHLARHGRANPAGIPYLYLASDPTTAVAELRPHTGEFVCIAKFQLPDNASVVDLRAPRVTVSPFMLAGENEIELVRKDIAFLEQLGNELTRPVLPQAAAIDYTPSQYLCEFIKACSFDGVLYRSSVGAGINLAMFAPSEAEFVELHVDQVRQVRVELTSENVC